MIVGPAREVTEVGPISASDLPIENEKTLYKVKRHIRSQSSVNPGLRRGNTLVQQMLRNRLSNHLYTKLTKTVSPLPHQ